MQRTMQKKETKFRYGSANTAKAISVGLEPTTFSSFLRPETDVLTITLADLTKSQFLSRYDRRRL